MWFKSKEEKEKELQTELNQLKVKYADEIDSYCKINSFIFILKGFKIQDNKIFVCFESKDTVKGYINYMELSWWRMRYDTSDFKIARYQFIKFKEDLNKIGLKLEKL